MEDFTRKQENPNGNAMAIMLTALFKKNTLVAKHYVDFSLFFSKFLYYPFY